MSRIRRLVGVAAIAACGPEGPNPPAEFEEICGTVGPHRLLALDKEVELTGWSMRRIGERLYFWIRTGDEGPEQGSWPKGPTPTASTVYSTGPCGEDPVRIADDIWLVYEAEQLPGVVLGCRGEKDFDLVALDPAGSKEPALLVAGGCLVTATDHGFVRDEPAGEETVQAVFYPYPDDVFGGPLEPNVLLEYADGEHPFRSFVSADEVIAPGQAGDIVRVSLPDGEVSVLQSGALAFEATERWLLWFDGASADDDPEEPTADVMLRDRQTGDEIFLGRRKLGTNWPWLRDDRVDISGGDDEMLFVDLEARQTIAVPTGYYPWYRLADGRWLTGTGFIAAPYHLLERDGTMTLLTTDDGAMGWGPDGLHILHVDVLTDDSYASDEGELWHYPYDLGEPELLARRVNWRHRHLQDGRIVTTVGVGEQWTGELVVVEPGTLAERTVDDHVNLVPQVHEETFGPDALVYAVRDGERSGVWVTRLAAE